MEDMHICLRNLKVSSYYLIKEKKQVKISPYYPKNEELISFGNLTQPILKNRVDPLLLVKMTRLEV
jgi:hypothetical protein